MMTTEAPELSKRPPTLLWLPLLLLAGIGWTITALQAREMGTMADMRGMAMGPSPAPLFLAVWVSMMVAMMFPSVAPMVSIFSTVGRNRRSAGGSAVPTWVFLAGYLAVWSLFGVGAYLLSLAVPAVGMSAPGLRTYSPLVGGIVLVLAGLYQWSPLKGVCLHHCRSPLGFLLHSWRNGYGGAFLMGFTHGAYCVGCCWGLMVVLFAVGLMNLGWMVLLAAVIFAEKIFRHGPLIGRLAGLGLVLFGLATLAAPWLGRPASMPPM
jgi:predicted metal-binding membrane protein